MFIYDNRKDKSINGLSCREGIQILNKKGIVSERNYPFLKDDNKRINLLKNNDTFKKAKPYRIFSYSKIITLEGLKELYIILVHA